MKRKKKNTVTVLHGENAMGISFFFSFLLVRETGCLY